MPAGAFVLAVSSACAHALWNLLLARARDSEAATAVALVAGAVVFAPVALVTWDVDGGVWPYAAASAALELAYFATLAAAYQHGELSVIYPVARGSAPVLVAVFNVAIVGAALTALTAAGVAAVAAGIVLVRAPNPRVRQALRTTYLLEGLGIGVLIAAYTLVDKAGLEHADPLPYLELVILPAAIAYPLAIRRRKGAAALRAELRPRTVLAGIAMFAAYGLVLAALRLAPQDFVPAVGALRETSVVIAVAAAALVLREPVGPRRAAGAAFVVAGVMALALA